MAQAAQKVPGADHPITIVRSPHRVRVVWRGKVIADTTAALDLQEASYPTVKYIPRADADMSLLQKTEHGSHCPYKGDASYFSVVVDGETSRNAIWTYETPFEAVTQIKDHLAFYPDRIDSIEEIAA